MKIKRKTLMKEMESLGLDRWQRRRVYSKRGDKDFLQFGIELCQEVFELRKEKAFRFLRAGEEKYFEGVTYYIEAMDDACRQYFGRDDFKKRIREAEIENRERMYLNAYSNIKVGPNKFTSLRRK